MTAIQITRRPIIAEVPAGATLLTEIIARIASIRGRAAEWGVTNDVTLAEFLAGQSVEADFTRDYYRDGFVEGGAPTILPGWSFSRASVGTAVNSAGGVETFAADVPRITDLGLLMEAATTNLAKRSQEFHDADIWVPVATGGGVNPVVTTNAAAAPDGTMTAESVVMGIGAGTTTGDLSLLFQPITVATATTYVSSIWFRADTPCTIALQGANGSGWSVKSVTTSWQRFDVTQATTSTSGSLVFGLVGGLTGQEATVQVWGGQLEVGTVPTSYIPTGASAATRAAGDASIDAALRASGGTLLAEFVAPQQAAITRVVLGTENGAQAPYVFSGVPIAYQAPGPGVLNAPGGAVAAGAVSRVAVTWETGVRRIVRDGGTVASDTQPLVSADTLYLGNIAGAGQLDSWLRRFVFFDTPVSAELLQAMTQ